MRLKYTKPTSREFFKQPEIAHGVCVSNGSIAKLAGLGDCIMTGNVAFGATCVSNGDLVSTNSCISQGSAATALMCSEGTGF